MILPTRFNKKYLAILRAQRLAAEKPMRPLRWLIEEWLCLAEKKPNGIPGGSPLRTGVFLYIYIYYYIYIIIYTLL